MPDHKYKIGQAVRIIVSTDLRRQVKLDRFVVQRLLPENPEGEPGYRIKSEREAFERLVGEREIAAC